MNRAGFARVAFCLLVFVPGYGQDYEVSPLVGGRFGGSFKLEQAGLPNFHADIADSFAYGVAAGIVLDGDDCSACNLIQFRWMRTSSHLAIPQNPLAPMPTAFHPSISLDHFLGDFSHEWSVEEFSGLKPYVLGTVGAVRMGAPESSATRFVFGLGFGMKFFASHVWGIRLEAEYLPIVLHAELQTLVCSGGCIVVLNGGISNQFLVSVGPVFRF